MKKTLYILLALCLVLTLAACGGGAGAGASNGIDSKHKHCVCVGKAVGVGTHTACANKDGWKEIGTAEELADAIAAASAKKPAYVALTADITVDAYLQISELKTVNVCLNGHKLNASTRVIGEMNITDCTGNGAVVGDKVFTIRTYAGAVVNVYAGTITTTGSKNDTQVVVLNGTADEDLQLAESESTFTLYGGKIQAAGKSTKNGHSVYIESYGVMKMYDGVICDGNTSGNGGNVAVWGNYGVFTMHGGEVKNGTAGGGGNLFAYLGDMYVYGGTVSGGRSTKYGGNISSNNKPGILEFKNCTIKDGVAEGTNGGNVYLNGTATIQANFENVTISGGMAGAEASGNGGNIFINQVVTASFKDCTISDGKSAYGSGIAVQGKEFLVELKGNMKFVNNQASDIFMLYYKDTQSWLSVDELTTTSPIVIGAKKKMVFTENTVANHPFVAIDGMAVTEVDGKLVIDKN